MTEVGREACRLASMGIAVFPVRARGKEPATRRGVHDATTDAEGLSEFFDAHPDLNLGAAMGSASGGLVAIDVDVDEDAGKDGYAELRRWESEHGELPETVTSISGSGGMHMIYRLPEGVTVGNGVNRGLGIDVRGEGGYVVVHPSVHPNGRRYEWENPPDEYPIAAADANVLALIEHVRPSASAAGPRLETPEVIGEGGRNDALYRAGASMRAKRLDPSLIADAMRGINAARCRPPLPSDELERTIRSVLDLPEGRSAEYEAAHQTDAPKPAGEPGETNDHDGTLDSAISLGIVRKTKGGTYTVAHNAFGRHLIEHEHACRVGTTDGMPAIWTGDRYSVGWHEIERMVTAHYDAATSGNCAEVRDYIKRAAPVRQESPARLIAFRNGVYDVGSDEFRAMTPDDLITNVIPHDYDPGADTEFVMSALATMSEYDQATMSNLMEAAGLCLYRSNNIGKCPVLLGQGQNGKSVYMRMLRAMLGPRNVSSLDVHVFGKQFQLAQLAGKLANIGDDISSAELSQDSLAEFRKVATGEEVYTDVKGKEGFSFVPRCTLVFSANTFPSFDDSTRGTTRRLFPIEFRHTYSADDPGYDPNISAKLTTEESCRALILLAIDGLRSVIAKNGFTPNHASERLLGEIKLKGDTVLQWIDDAGVSKESLTMRATADAYVDYTSWCGADGGVKNPVNRNTFTGRIKAIFRLDSAPLRGADGTLKRRFFEPCDEG